jgi:hypothetical protein
MKCASLEIEGKKLENVEISSHYEKLTVQGRDYDLNKVESSRAHLPRCTSSATRWVLAM